MWKGLTHLGTADEQQSDLVNASVFDYLVG